MDTELPFLIEHGGWLWIAVVIALWSVAVAALAIGRWRRARRALRDTLGAIRAWPAREGEVILRGRLGAREPGVVIAQVHTGGAGGPRFAWQREAWIETAEEKVRIADGAAIWAGAMSAARFGVPRATPDAMLQQHAALHRPRLWGPVRRATLVALSTGDEVIARGRLERRPEAEGGGYRDGAHVSLLRAVGHGEGDGDARIEIAATAPRAVARPLSLGALGALAVPVALAVVLGFHMVGAGALVDCRGPLGASSPPAHLERETTAACAVAAAAPSTRGEALFMLSEHRTAWSCALVKRELAGARLEAALAAAERCGREHERAAVLVAAGRFAEAAALTDHPLQWIAAGSWRDTARVADARLAARSSRMEPRELAYARCFVDLLHHRAGDPGAADRLRQRMGAQDGVVCIPFAAQLAAPEERIALLRGADLEQAFTRSRSSLPLLDALRWRYGLPARVNERSGPAYGTSVLGFGTRPGVSATLTALVAGRVVDDPSADEFHQLRTREWRAARRLLDAGPAAAREAQLAAEPGAAADRPGGFESGDRSWLAGSGEELMELQERALDPRGAFYRALQEAAQGDGERLARVLAEPELMWLEDELLGVVPQIRSGRDRVRAALERRLSSASWDDPLVIVSVAALRARLFRWLGAPDTAARWRRVADTILAAVDDDDRLFAMWAWAELDW